MDQQGAGWPGLGVWGRTARELVEYSRLQWRHGPSDPRPLYAVLQPHNLPGERLRFMNLGYWADPRLETMDEGGRALADLLGRSAGLGPDSRVLDVGFGFGDQVLHWLDTFEPREVDGVNLSESQVRVARERIAQHPLGGRVRLHVASACELPFERERFEQVLALESAFHFAPRRRFFEEAFRVLRPGGRLATADLLLMPGSWMGCNLVMAWRVHPDNLCDRHQYAAQLRHMGFVNVRVESIREHVFEPYYARLARRLRHPEVVRRMNPFLRAACMPNPVTRALMRGCDYVIAVAEKPGR